MRDQESSSFKWTAPRRKAAFALADGATREEAAAEAEVTDRTIYTWLNAGKLVYVRTAGGAVRIDKDSLFRPGEPKDAA